MELVAFPREMWNALMTETYGGAAWAEAVFSIKTWLEDHGQDPAGNLANIMPGNAPAPF